MTGGGARAAYQVGVLRFICKKYKGFQPPIITGVSAGAVNAAHLSRIPRRISMKPVDQLDSTLA